MKTAALWLACVFAGLAIPPAPAVPQVLVDAPIAARIAANDIAHWKALGASGFLFSGIYDNLLGEPQGGVQDLGPTTPESQLLKEIRLSNEELEAGGLGENFLRVSMGPDAAWFSDRDRARQAVDFFQAAGLFCQRAGLRGIALDLRPESPMYRYGWSKYDLDNVSTARLAESARELGRRGMRAFIREMPDANLIFIAESLDRAGPLWYPLFEGLLESVGAASSIRLDLVVRLPANANGFDAMTQALEDLEARLCGTLGEEARQIWQRQGGYIPLLDPLVEIEGTVSATLSTDAWRARIAAAKLVAADYVAVRGDYGTWWQLSDKQARSYAKLRQRPVDAPRATPRPPKDRAMWDFIAPFDRMERVGPHSDSKDAPYCFVDGPRAASLFWKAPAMPIVPDDGASALLATPLSTRKATTIAPEGGAIAPERVPTPALIGGLPLAPWAGPASLWCAFDAVPAVGQSRVPVRVGMRNVFPGELSGVIEVKTPDTLSLGVTEFPILLQPGQSAVFEQPMQGRFDLGEPLRLTLAFRAPAAAGIERSFRATPHLATKWQHQRDGAIATPPLLIPGSDPIVVVASAEGDVAGYGANGTQVWQRRFAPPLQLSPWPGRVGTATACVAIADAKGTVRVLGSRSEALWETTFSGPSKGLFFADLFAVGIDCLLLSTTSGSLVCFGPDGHEAWRTADESAPYYICTPAQLRHYSPTKSAGTDEERLYLAFAGDTPRLLRLGAHGAPVWTRTLPGKPSAAPVYFPATASLPARLAVPLSDGDLAFFSADIGRDLGIVKLGITEALRLCAPLEFAQDHAGPEMILLHGDKASLLDAQGTLLWGLDGLRAQQLSVIGGIRGPTLILLGGGQLTGLSPAGKILWQDRTPTAPRALAAKGFNTQERGLLFVGTDEGRFQAIELPIGR